MFRAEVERLEGRLLLASDTWQPFAGGTTNFSDPRNWSEGTAPTAQDTAVINLGKGPNGKLLQTTVTLDRSLTFGNLEIDLTDLTIDTQGNTLDLTGGGVGGQLNVGWGLGNAAFLAITGGGAINCNAIQVGSGNLDINGYETTVTASALNGKGGNLTAGNSTGGVVDVTVDSGATLNTDPNGDASILGLTHAKATAWIEGASAEWNSGPLWIGSEGFGYLEVHNGGHVDTQGDAIVDYRTNFAPDPGTSGTVRVDGADAQWNISGRLDVVVPDRNSLDGATITIKSGGAISSAGGEIGTANAGGTLAAPGTGKVAVMVDGGTWTSSKLIAFGGLGNGSNVAITVQNDGRIHSDDKITIDNSAHIRGDATLDPASKTVSLGTGAIVEPGTDSNPTGTLAISSDFDASAGLTFDADLGSHGLLGGQGASDLIAVSGNATLGGNFYATSLVDPTTYVAGDWFSVFTAASLTGQFANLPAGPCAGGTALPQLASGLAWNVVYSSGALTLEVIGPPEATSAGFSVGTGSTMTGQLAISNPVAGVPVTYQVATQPQNGTVSIVPSTGVFTYTSGGVTGLDTFTYTAANAAGTGDPATVQVYVYSDQGGGRGAPTVIGISPNTGPDAGGTLVTITGVGFNGATAVNFGSTPATSFSVNAAGTQITAIDPAGSGTVYVTVTGPFGTSGGWINDEFTYPPIPPFNVTSVVVNGDNPNGLYTAAGQPSNGAQRSMVEDIVYTFSTPVIIYNANQAFSVARSGNGATGTVPPTLYTQAVPGSNGTQWAVTVSGQPEGTLASIATGEYSITIKPQYVFAAFDGTEQLSAGRTDTFYCLFGDVTGDRVVNAIDNAKFKDALITYNAAFDYNGDDVVNAFDNAEFKSSMSISFLNDGFVTTI